MGAVKALVLEHPALRVEPCGTCHGDRFVDTLVIGRGAGPEGLEPTYKTRACPDCGGTGVSLDAEHAAYLDGLADDASLEVAFQDHLFITSSREEELSASQPIASSPVRAHQRQ